MQYRSDFKYSVSLPHTYGYGYIYTLYDFNPSVLNLIRCMAKLPKNTEHNINHRQVAEQMTGPARTGAGELNLLLTHFRWVRILIGGRLWGFAWACSEVCVL